jgi:hypothetical protein
MPRRLPVLDQDGRPGPPRREARFGIRTQNLIDARLDAVFGLYDELIASLDGAQLRQSLPVPSNPIGMQLWCVIGARETWARAIEKGTWGPFTCSIGSFEETQKPGLVADALARSGRTFREAARANPEDETRIDFKLALLEHESQHLGQILRYLLGLRIDPPPGWKKRFALG